MNGKTQFDFENSKGIVRHVVQFKLSVDELGIGSLIEGLNVSGSNYRLINADEYEDICRAGYVHRKDVYYVGDSGHIGYYTKDGVNIVENNLLSSKVMVIEDGIKSMNNYKVFLHNENEKPFSIIADDRYIELSLNDVVSLVKEMPKYIGQHNEYLTSRNCKIYELEKQIIEMQKQLLNLKNSSV